MVPDWLIITQITTFTKSSLKKALKYLLVNCHFKLGNIIFRKVLGIPIGLDPAPFMAIFSLYCYKTKWYTKLKK